MPAISLRRGAAAVGVEHADRDDLHAPAQAGDAAGVVAARADDPGDVRAVAVLVIAGSLAVDQIAAEPVVDHAVAVVIAAVGRILGVLPQVGLQVGMVALHAGVEHRDLRAAGPLVPGAGRVDVVVVLLFDRVLLADAGVVGVLGDADRGVVFDAQHAVAAAQPGPEIFEADPLSGADRERPDQTQPQSKPAAGAADDLLPARLARCRRRNCTSRRLTGGVSPRGFASRSLRKVIAPAGDAIPTIRTVSAPNTTRRGAARTTRRYLVVPVAANTVDEPTRRLTRARPAHLADGGPGREEGGNTPDAAPPAVSRGFPISMMHPGRGEAALGPRWDPS